MKSMNETIKKSTVSVWSLQSSRDAAALFFNAIHLSHIKEADIHV